MDINCVLVDIGQLSEKQLAEIDAFVGQAKYTHFYQDRCWGPLVHGYQNLKVLLNYQDNRLIAYSVIREHFVKALNKYKFYIERGPVFENESGLSAHLIALKQTLAEHNALWVTLSPYLFEHSACREVFLKHGFSNDARNKFAYRTTLTLDLTDSLESIRASFRRSLKTQLNKAERLDVTFKCCNSPSEFEQFFGFFDQFRFNKGLARSTHEHHDSIYKRFIESSNQNCIWLAMSKQKVLAGIGLFNAGDTVVYEWGCSTEDEECRKLPLSHLLHWRGIEWAKHLGYQKYDFGGYWEELGDNNSINRFKSGFSKHIERMLPPQIYCYAPFLTRLSDMGGYLKRGVSMLAPES